MKRVLSLAVSTVMLFGMMVVGTGAANYADVDASNNLEAIEVLKAVGVMEGDDKGNFNPDQNVTRNEMAVIMCNLLDLKAGGTSPFTDVPAWAQPYVAACYNNGVIAGTSATTFGGSDNVTSAQAGLMVMKALGYFGFQGEFGDDWKVATVKQATKIDLFNGMNVYTDEALTRDDVAKLVLNALESDVVVAEEIGGMTVEGNGITVVEKARYNYPVAQDKADHDYDGVSNNGLQLCEKLYGSDLKKNTGAGITDDYGRPATQWTYDETTITAPADATLTYTEGVKGKTIWADLDKGNFTYDATPVATEFVRFVDGVAADNGYVINKTESNKFGGQGILTEVYYDADTKTVVIVESNTFAVEVIGDYDAKDEQLTISFIEGAPYGLGTTLSSDDYDNLDKFEDGDIVLVTVANDGSYYIDTLILAEKVTGEVASYTVDETVNLDGTAYKYNAGYVSGTGAGGTYTIGSDYDAWLDTYGNIILTDGVAAEASQYVFVTEIANPAGLSATNNMVASMYFTDGTYEAGKVVKYNNLAPTAGTKNAWCTFTEEDGEYTLMPVAQVGGANEMSEKITENGKVTINLNGAATTKGTNATIFVVLESDYDVKLYTGIKNVPTFTTADGTSSTWAVNNANSYAKYVFIDQKSAVATDTAAESSDLVYIMDYTAYKTSVDTNKKTYYTYDAIVNGEKTTIDAYNTSAFNAYALFVDVEYNSYGYVTAAVELTSANTGSGNTYEDFSVSASSYSNATVTQNNGILTVNTDSFALADGVKIYVIGTDDSVATYTAKALANKYNGSLDGTITGVLEDGEYTALYIDLGE